MWIYKKQLQFPVNIRATNPRLAKIITSQIGGPDGELAAAMRYLQQRYHMNVNQVKGMLTDIGTEELAHLEIVSSVVSQLLRRMTPDQARAMGFDDSFVDHTVGAYLQSAAGVPFTAAYLQVKGDPITDLHENMAAEQKARTTYENILRLSDDPDVNQVMRFLRAREIVHYQRFGEMLRLVQDRLSSRNYYAFNPAFDTAQHGQGGDMGAEADTVQVTRTTPTNPILDNSNPITRVQAPQTAAAAPATTQQTRQAAPYTCNCSCANLCTRYGAK